MEGQRSDVVKQLYEKYKIDILPSTVDLYRRLGLLQGCIIREPASSRVRNPKIRTIYDVEKTVERIKRIIELKSQRFYLYEIKRILKEESEKQ